MARILIVEDNSANLKLATFLLESEGHVVLQALDAEAGILIAREQALDLILMDIQLPGMDGLAATRLLKADERTHHVRIVALTALAMIGDRERMMAAGCDDCITKPFRFPVFLKTVSDSLRPQAILTST